MIRVPTPGTPVRIATDETLRASQILVRVVPGFTGKTYFGVAGINKYSAAMPGVIRVLAEPAAAGCQDGEAIPPALNPFGQFCGEPFPPGLRSLRRWH